MLVPSIAPKLTTQVVAKVLDRDGNEVARSRPAQNRLLNNGIFLMMDGVDLTYNTPIVKIGSDSTPVDPDHTTIIAPLRKAGQTNWYNFGTYGYGGDKTRCVYTAPTATEPGKLVANNLFTATYETGAIVGTVWEVGLDFRRSSTDGKVQTRLVFDAGITVTADHQLIIEYLFEVEAGIPLPVTFDLTIEGTTQTYTVTPYLDISFTQNANSNFFSKIFKALSSYMSSWANEAWDTGVYWTATNASYPYATVVDDRVALVKTLTAKLKTNEANYPDGLIGAFRISDGPLRYKIEPPLPKPTGHSVVMTWQIDYSKLNSA